MMEDQKYEPCYVAFLDMLGFSAKVEDSNIDRNLFDNLLKAMKCCGQFPSGEKQVQSNGEIRAIPIQSQFFSDSIVFFIKEETEDLPHLLLVIRYLQDRLWEHGICLRGGISLGDMYWPDNGENITLGSALLEAYELESKIAIYPRIVFSEKLKKSSLKINAAPFGRQGSTLDDFIRTDADGIHFLDLLHKDISRNVDESFEKQGEYFYLTRIKGNALSDLLKIKKIVQNIINDNIGVKNLRIKQKYEWLQTYLDNNGLVTNE